MLKDGFAAAQRINARVLLRDYSELYHKIHLQRAERPLADYYRQLADWLTAEIAGTPGQILAAPSKGAKVPRQKSQEGPKSPSGHWLQLMVLGLLGLLIILLLTEIIRLRKLGSN